MWVPLTPLDFYRRSRHLFAEKCGVVDHGRRLTFGDFGERVERLAGALRAMGLRPKERVSMLTFNTHHLLEGFYGVPLAGGVINPINPRFAPLEIAQLQVRQPTVPHDPRRREAEPLDRIGILDD